MRNRIFIISLIIFLVTRLNGQISQGGQPFSSIYKNLTNNFEQITLSKPDISQLAFNDLMDSLMSNPYRIGVSIYSSLSIDYNGSWQELPDKSGRIWRLMLTAPDAKALSIYCKDFYLPSGTKLFLYNPEKTKIIGAFTQSNNHQSGIFATEMITGESLILEYYEPYGIGEKAIINISEIAYFYRGVSGSKSEQLSGECEVNINCSEGNNWQDQKQGVCKIQIKSGGEYFFCSGSMVNNTSNDFTPYVLLSDHCTYNEGYPSTSDLNGWIFYFHYESTTCEGTAPYGTRTFLGCQLMAHDTYGSNEIGSDFFLVKLNSIILSTHNIYYNGWSRSTSPSSSGVSIHHPDGDIKKISTYSSPVTSVYVGAPNSHWQVIWVSTSNGHGVTEGGSSGSPLFNSSGLIIGTLTGGNSYCTSPGEPDYYGKFSYHWSSNGTTSSKQLKPWLDPGNTNVTTLTGLYGPANIKSYDKQAYNIYAYPNPANTDFFISLNDNHFVNPVINIYSLLGKLVKQVKYEGILSGDIKISTDTKLSGLHFIYLEAENTSASCKITFN